MVPPHRALDLVLWLTRDILVKEFSVGVNMCLLPEPEAFTTFAYVDQGAYPGNLISQEHLQQLGLLKKISSTSEKTASTLWFGESAMPVCGRIELSWNELDAKYVYSGSYKSKFYVCQFPEEADYQAILGLSWIQKSKHAGKHVRAGFGGAGSSKFFLSFSFAYLPALQGTLGSKDLKNTSLRHDLQTYDMLTCSRP
jgi:hypothetical protein